MKWVFLLGLLVFTPWLTAHLKANPKHLPYAGFAIGILPFMMSGLNLTASPIAWPYWPGPVKGMDVSLIDAVALAVLMSSRRVSTPVAIKISFAIYMLAVVISTLRSAVMMASFFYLWQLVRVALVYAAVARATVTHPKVAVAVLMGAGAGLGFQAFIALKEYLGGNTHAGGWFGHQNLLGMASHFAVYPFVALLLAGNYTRQASAIVLSGLIVAFTGGSRATIGLFAIGLVVTLCLSLWRKSTGRKAAVAGLLVIGLVASLPAFLMAVERRSADQRANSNLERSLMINAAKMIITDFPMGVGPNRYVVVANTGGYAARAGIAWNPANREAPVHNSYYLVTAEMGWLGIIGLLSLLGSIIAISIKAVRRATKQVEAELLVGVSVSLIIFSIHAYYEWITMYYQIHYLVGITAGLSVGLRTLSVRHGPAVKNRPVARSPEPLVAQ